MLLLLAVCSGSAYAATVTWIQGLTLGANSYIGTSGFATRTYIDIWRPTGNSTLAFYSHQNGTVVYSNANSTSNPFQWLTGDSYAKAWCQNLNNAADVVPYTCQTDS